MHRTLRLISCMFFITYGSSPFINRWGFEECADYVYDISNDHMSCRRNNFKSELIKRGDIVFMRRGCVDSFLKDEFPRIKHPFIMISHVDDQTIDSSYTPYLDNPKLLAWFSINIGFKHPKLKPIPIGIIQVKDIYDRDQEFSQIFEQKRALPKERLLYMNFSVHSNPHERSAVRRLFAGKPFCTDVPPGKPFLEYIDEMAQHEYTLSPLGGGYDCYRTWEALVVGSIPIVRASPIADLYKDLPVIVVQDWRSITPEFLRAAYSTIKNGSYRWEKLQMSYWLTKIRSVQKRALQAADSGRSQANHQPHVRP